MFCFCVNEVFRVVLQTSDDFLGCLAYQKDLCLFFPRFSSNSKIFIGLTLRISKASWFQNVSDNFVVVGRALSCSMVKWVWRIFSWFYQASSWRGCSFWWFWVLSRDVWEARFFRSFWKEVSIDGPHWRSLSVQHWRKKLHVEISKSYRAYGPGSKKVTGRQWTSYFLAVEVDPNGRWLGLLATPPKPGTCGWLGIFDPYRWPGVKKRWGIPLWLSDHLLLQASSKGRHAVSVLRSSHSFGLVAKEGKTWAETNFCFQPCLVDGGHDMQNRIWPHFQEGVKEPTSEPAEEAKTEEPKTEETGGWDCKW